MSMQHVPIRRAVIEKNLISNIERNHNQTNYTANNHDVTSTFIFFTLSQLGTYVYDWYALKTANEHHTLIFFYFSNKMHWAAINLDFILSYIYIQYFWNLSLISLKHLHIHWMYSPNQIFQTTIDNSDSQFNRVSCQKVTNVYYILVYNQICSNHNYW